MYEPLARKYRPKTFSQVFGQKTSSTILINSILMGKEIKTMLITVIRGTGKTTLARLYAKALNCDNFKELKDPCCACESCLEAENGSHPDILEIDTASHTGVDFVRDLEKITQQIPLYNKRVMIFDEAHMFSKQAQAAVLKPFEEPPEQLVVMLVTTNPEKLMDTIRSRCLSLPLKALTSQDVEANMRYILEQEGKEYTEDFISTLGRIGGGALRDVQQVLDQCLLAAGDQAVDISYLETSVGVVSTAQYRQLAPVLCALKPKKSLEWVNKWYLEGVDLELLYIEGVPALLRDFSVILAGAYQVTLMTGLPVEKIKKKLTLNYNQVKMIIEIWEELLEMMKATSQPKLVWEIFFMRICEGE